ncbi:type II toxin-antitoxin system VapC family toxin [Crocosphaera sp. Alani8]|uniref:type II toxin-antitoxin system VapC family toxin n=1 Tax=Crocosphaera sp. Alani8 TaxID=3038952 RepID=UPI00313BEF2B
METRGIIADTGHLYAAIDIDGQYHQRSRQELKVINQQKLAILVPYSIYLETHKLILQSLGITAALRFTRDIEKQVNFINPTSEDYQAATSIITKFPEQKITLFDAVTVVLASQIKLPVWTYDYHFDIMKADVWR